MWATTLPPVLLEWCKELESSGRAEVYVAYVEWDRRENTYSLPPETPKREYFTQYLRNPEFARSFQQAHALTAAHRQTNGPEVYLIFVNMGLRDQWREYETVLLAHELAHVWILVQGFPSPRSQPGKAGCLSVATADLVQHVLLREELRRRGIDHSEYQRSKVRHTLESPADAAPSQDQCLQVGLVSEWVDTRLELGVIEDYEKLIAERHPAVPVVGLEILNYLRTRNLRDKAVHREALGFVFYRLRGLWDTGK